MLYVVYTIRKPSPLNTSVGLGAHWKKPVAINIPSTRVTTTLIQNLNSR